MCVGHTPAGLEMDTSISVRSKDLGACAFRLDRPASISEANKESRSRTYSGVTPFNSGSTKAISTSCIWGVRSVRGSCSVRRGLSVSAPLMMAGLGARGTREALIKRAFLALQCLVKSLCTLGHREREDGILRRAVGEHQVAAAQAGLGKEVAWRRAIIVVVGVGVVGIGVSSVVGLRRSVLDG